MLDFNVHKFSSMVGKFAFGIAGVGEIEVVAIANGFAERKGFQLGIVEFGVFSGHFEFTPAHYLDAKV